MISRNIKLHKNIRIRYNENNKYTIFCIFVFIFMYTYTLWLSCIHPQQHDVIHRHQMINIFIFITHLNTNSHTISHPSIHPTIHSFTTHNRNAPKVLCTKIVLKIFMPNFFHMEVSTTMNHLSKI